MPTSYRESDERADDEIAYFAYAVEKRRARWRALLTASVGSGAGAFVCAAAFTGNLVFGAVVAGLALPAGALLAAMAARTESESPGELLVRRRQTAGQCSRSRSSLTGVDQSRSQ